MSAEIAKLYAEWLPRINAHGISEAEMATITDEIAEIERKIAEAHAITARELLIKVRIAEARDHISAAIRHLKAKPDSLKGRSASRIAREPHRVAMVHAWGETDLAAAFIMLGHALGVEYPEALLALAGHKKGGDERP